MKGNHNLCTKVPRVFQRELLMGRRLLLGNESKVNLNRCLVSV